MGYNMREEFMVLDLNQEPLDQPDEFESMLNELETTHGQIEERIRQLEAVTARARQRARRNVSAGHAASDSQNEGRLHSSHDDTAGQERTRENGKAKTRDCTILISKALDMDPNAKEESNGGSYFDCNICLSVARDPILTCCGHLFCWPCFYQLSYADSKAKECYVCKGKVTDSSIIPIYGNGNYNRSRESKVSGLKFPPRPHAHRIESMRQRSISQRLSPSQIEERIQQISYIFGAMGERTRAQPAAERSNFAASRYRTSRTLPSAESTSNQHYDSSQVSRLLFQGAVSFSSLSSELNSAVDNAERFVEDLQAYSNSRHMRRNHRQPPHVDNADATSNVAALLQPEIQTPVTAGEISAAILPSDLSFGTDIVPLVVGSDSQTMDAEINSTVFSRRRSGVPLVSDVNYEVSRVARRRRLR
ncbi:hypothetical protein FEM48_Zijuj01G0025800 [Ziziphus jujuba var. spinosa]|uniref:E3 ubiquitin-protein ligase RMA n=1 Tax=Ziziphus jujuba var. spinosa TaxID=714518 RepID=A0A978VYM6_ZIZJJ|nr:hypothetical protein FEM48_Zijuj01G0025800 [Ziziphus jujuba var. spinosa]